MGKRSTRVVGIALCLAGFLFGAGLLGLPAVRGGNVIPTNTWVDFYGADSTYLAAPVPVGATIAIFDPQGTQCGEFTVTRAGMYGIMPCYGDDPTTPQDEGAVSGDVLRFTINGLPARTAAVSTNGVPVAPETVVTWNPVQGLWQVDLRVETAVTVTPTQTLAATGTATPTPISTRTLTPTASSTATPTATSTPTATPTATHSPTVTPTLSPTPTETRTAAPIPTSTPTASRIVGGIEGAVWADRNHDGQWQEDEPGLPAIVVRLSPSGTEPGAEATEREVLTDGGGRYRLTDVTPGNYLVEVAHPAGYWATTKPRFLAWVQAATLITLPSVGLCRLTMLYLPMVARR